MLPYPFDWPHTRAFFSGEDLFIFKGALIPIPCHLLKITHDSKTSKLPINSWLNGFNRPSRMYLSLIVLHVNKAPSRLFEKNLLEFRLGQT